ncbi:LysM peptidoglycan-binding domain-containing protein [Paenibacillus naphthalenovorans]|uniref:LysM peptidoglycan-binding domain-containing protein n=1 Tax=Paenibacillus naphthalenovorans TaxID=162209 RepID=UPI00087FB5A7|nr:LysM peptidoglycan-binding domain-containing protein [Paenibacillus naphthalenovorans]SDJ76271.1 LysM domain-containing protein [Paenibacillus naphthalenovorans]
MKYGIWLSWNNQEEGFELPILPREIGPSINGDGTGHDVFGLGKINVIKDRGLAEYTIESIFPAQPYPFITASIVLQPREYVDYILKWWETKRPIRFVYVGSTMEINTPASVEGFEWKEVAGSPGDIQFSLKLKEYRFYAARRVQVAQQQDGAPAIQKEGPKRPDDREPSKTYTLTAGDNLWKVAQKVLGDGSRWREIQRLNGLTDAQLKSLPVGLTLKLPEQGGAAYA